MSHVSRVVWRPERTNIWFVLVVKVGKRNRQVGEVSGGRDADEVASDVMERGWRRIGKMMRVDKSCTGGTSDYQCELINPT